MIDGIDIQTELCEGGSLEERLKQGRRFSEEQLKEIIRQVVLVSTNAILLYTC